MGSRPERGEEGGQDGSVLERAEHRHVEVGGARSHDEHPLAALHPERVEDIGEATRNAQPGPGR